MAQLFSVTVSPDTIPLKDGAGKVAFTYANQSGKPLRVRLVLRPEGTTKAEWLKIEGDTEHDLASNKSEQAVVSVKVPSNASGRFRFQLRVESVDNRDEDYTDSPTVSFVAEPTPDVVKKFPWMLVAAIAAVVLCAGLAVAYFMAQKPELGEPCDDGTCADGLACAGGVCKGPAAYAGCTTDDQCVFGSCKDGTCGPRPGETCEGTVVTEGLICKDAVWVGAPGFSTCATDAECAFGCTNGTCNFPGLGQPCTDQCSGGFTCMNNVCRGQTRQQCSSDQDCLPDHACVSSLGERSCLKRAGEACTSNGDCTTLNCRSGQCAQGLADGSACTNPPQCTSGVCRSGACFSPRANGTACQANDDCASGRCAPQITVVMVPVIDSSGGFLPGVKMEQRKVAGPPVCQASFFLSPAVLEAARPIRRVP